MNIHTCHAGIHVLNDSFHRGLSNHLVHLIHFELIRHIVALSGEELCNHLEPLIRDSQWLMNKELLRSHLQMLLNVLNPISTL